MGDTLFSHEIDLSHTYKIEDLSFYIWNTIFTRFKATSADSNVDDRAFVKRLYDKYGGNLTFSKIRSFGNGYYPADAYRLYFKDKERKGQLIFLNEIAATNFWSSFEYRQEEVIQKDP